MALFIFARIRARQGQEGAVAAALANVVSASRAEPGCRAIAAFRRDRRCAPLLGPLALARRGRVSESWRAAAHGAVHRARRAAARSSARCGAHARDRI